MRHHKVIAHANEGQNGKTPCVFGSVAVIALNQILKQGIQTLIVIFW